ncbi:hypothetical protein DPX16_18909 [Anabarilius grahami]|uniref:Uncharacterized protein n=1 Tax=Anabarilius grahami TaxID=495550 RepID=A0A3N0YMJ4_ANAGA|nr:hypothetical protein DPX16_18909 [Anabarilius grahami]
MKWLPSCLPALQSNITPGPGTPSCGAVHLMVDTFQGKIDKINKTTGPSGTNAGLILSPRCSSPPQKGVKCIHLASIKSFCLRQSEIKRQQADVQLRQLKGETFPSQTAGKFAAEEKKDDTEHNSEIQCIITRANQRSLQPLFFSFISDCVFHQLPLSHAGAGTKHISVIPVLISHRIKAGWEEEEEEEEESISRGTTRNNSQFALLLSPVQGQLTTD